MEPHKYSDYIKLAKKSYQLALDSVSEAIKDHESQNAVEFCEKAIMLEPDNLDRQKEVANLLSDIIELKINIGTQVHLFFNEMLRSAKNLSEEELPLYSVNTPINEAVLDYWFKGIETFDILLNLCPTQENIILGKKATVIAETFGLMQYTKSDLLRAFSLLNQLVSIVKNNNWQTLDTLIEETFYDGGIEAGRLADTLSNNDKETASYLYDLARDSLTEAQYRTAEVSTTSEPTMAQQFCDSGVTAKSLLSMLIRYYHLDPNLYKIKLEEAKTVFEELSTKYPNTVKEMYYNRACIAGIENNVEDTIKYLELGRLGGCLPSKYDIQNDRDFDLIKKNKLFKQWLKSI